MLQHSSDPRSQKTRQQILQVFQEMLMEKEISQITIKELTDRVGINRKTFYRHYHHIEDLITDFEDYIIETSLKNCEHIIMQNDFHAFIAECFYFGFKYRELIDHWKTRTDLRNFYHKLYKRWTETTSRLPIWPNCEHPRYVKEFAYGAIEHMQTLWSQNKNEISIDEFVELGTNMIVNGIYSICNKI